MAAPYKILFNFGNIEIFELQLLHQIMTGKQKTGKLTDMTKQYPFL